MKANSIIMRVHPSFKNKVMDYQKKYMQRYNIPPDKISNKMPLTNITKFIADNSLINVDGFDLYLLNKRNKKSK